MKTGIYRGKTLFRAGSVAGLLVSVLVLAGCSSGGPGGRVTPFERGFDDGFADDSEYFLGYDDSWFTVGIAPVFYQGGDIPFIGDFSYDAGFYDGLFFAYNDGYFIAYRYAFIIGFSEGYDNAFAPDFLDFLANDLHTEFLNGGFTDGYNDGFTEGRIFGAFDFEALLPFDWLDAFLDWESGTDLFFQEIGVGTGSFGPAIFYEWGVDPHVLRTGEAPLRRTAGSAMKLRGSSTTQPRIVETRPLDTTQIDALNQTPANSLRNQRPLTLAGAWLDRIRAYEGIAAARTSASRNSRTQSPRYRPPTEN